MADREKIKKDAQEQLELFRKSGKGNTETKAEITRLIEEKITNNSKLSKAVNWDEMFFQKIPPPGQEREKCIAEFIYKIIEICGKGANRYFYDWISLTRDGMVFCVGKSSFSIYPNSKRLYIGDIFTSFTEEELNKCRPSIPDEIILSVIAQDVTPPYTREIVEMAYNFLTEVIIIPLNVDNDEEALAIETEIGNLLINNCVPILNKESHLR